MALAIRCAKIAIHHDESRTLIATGSLPLISRIKIQIETKLWKRFKCKGEENSILFLVTGVVPHHRTNRGNPVRQVTIDGVALFLENADCAFVLLLKSKSPVVADSVVSAGHEKAAMLEKRVVVEVAMSRAELKILDWLHRNRCVDFSKTRIECRNLGINLKRHQRQRVKVRLVEEILARQ